MQERSSILDDIFESFLEGSSIFRDRDVLRHDYIPHNLPHREDHIRLLGEMLAPALKGSPPSNVFIYGKTGTGKTAVMKFVLSKLTQKCRELGSPVKVCFANCRLTGTEYRILSNLCSSINVSVPFTGIAVGEVFDRFKAGLNRENILLLVVLDEIDSIVKRRGDILLYELTRINEGLKSSKVTILGISNDLKFKELLDPRVLSTLSEEEIVFRPYNADELRDILQDRAKTAFYDNVVSDGAITLCAALAAAEHGDARRALDLLRVAGEVAERKGGGHVSEDHVRQAQKRIEHDRALETMKSLPTHSKIVLLSVYLLTKLNITHSITGDIYNLYCELCEELGLDPLTQRRVSGLINELDIIGLLNSRVISLGRYGRTRKTRLGVPRRTIKKAFLGNKRFTNIMGYKPRYFNKPSH